MLLRYTSVGVLDTSFANAGISYEDVTNGPPSPAKVLVQSDGKNVVGAAGRETSKNNFLVARYTSTGSLDPSFGASGLIFKSHAGQTSVLTGLVAQSNGQFVSGGYVDDGLAMGNNYFALMRYMYQ